MVANIELEKSCTVMMAHQSCSLIKSVKNAHALIAHTCGMMTPIKSNCNELR